MISGRVPTMVITFMRSPPGRDAARGTGRGARGRAAGRPRTCVTSSSSPTLVMLCTHIVGMSTNAGLVAADAGKSTTSSWNSRRSAISASPSTHEEPLDLVQVVVLAAGDARDGRRDERLPGAAVAAHRLDELAARVGVHRERRSGSAAGNERRAVGVEQVDARTASASVGISPRGVQRVELARARRQHLPMHRRGSPAGRTLRVVPARARRCSACGRVLRVQQRDLAVVRDRWALRPRPRRGRRSPRTSCSPAGRARRRGWAAARRRSDRPARRRAGEDARGRRRLADAVRRCPLPAWIELA